MKIIFFGSSEFSLSALQACLASNEVVFIITTPPQKQGRGLKETPTPVQIFAEAQKISFAAPVNLKDPALIERVKSLKPDLMVVASYGKMIPSSWLKIPSKLCLNVHPSLLPKYRGAAPLNWPILNGDKETGMTIAEVTSKLDAGDIFYQEKIVLPENLNALELENLLAQKSIPALQSVFHAIETKTLKRHIQNESDFTYAEKLKKENGLIDWTCDAIKIHNQIRGLTPWPMAYTFFDQNPIQIICSRISDASKVQGKPGEIIALKKPQGFEVQTGKGLILIEKLKPAGKKEMSGIDFANGMRLSLGMILGE